MCNLLGQPVPTNAVHDMAFGAVHKGHLFQR